MKAKKIYKLSGSFLVSALLACAACEQFTEIDPPRNEIISETVFASDASAMSAMRGIYSLMMTNQSFTNGHIEKYCGLSADELVDLSGRAEQSDFENNSLTATNQAIFSVFWKEAYTYINNANAVIEGVEKSRSISAAVKTQITGEARFVRAFCHFYLVNLFGEIPYITSTDYRLNSRAARMPINDVYQLIIQDLTSAETELSGDYSFANHARVQPTKAAASAMLARTYLFLGDWAKAEAYATKVIDNVELYTLATDLNETFLANGPETIWQLQPVTPELSTGQARLFLLLATPNDVVLRDELINAFETGDLRRDQWVRAFQQGDQLYYYSFKYKVYSAAEIVEQASVIRLAELYLTRAEALAQQNNLAAAIQDVDVIRGRAGLPLVNATNPSISRADLLQVIEHERRIEFFLEWGHRWLDLKRTNRTADVLSPLKGDWQVSDEYYPIPNSERLANPNLTQNAGY